MGRAAALAVLGLLVAGCGGNGESSVRFSDTQELGDARTVEVTFESHGAKLAGTLKVPTAEGPHPALVWVHGSGEEARDTAAPYYTNLLDPRYALFAFDKRGSAGRRGGAAPSTSSCSRTTCSPRSTLCARGTTSTTTRSAFSGSARAAGSSRSPRRSPTTSRSRSSSRAPR